MPFQFDAEFYLAQNPDVAAAIDAGSVESAEWHYVNYGAAEGRDPNAVFDTSAYLAANPDVADAVEKGIIDPLTHFLQYGAAEGRAPNAEYQAIAEGFDEQAYLDANPDVAAAVDNGVFATGYQHWVLYGEYEEARASATYNDGTAVTEITQPIIGNATELTTDVDTLTGTAGSDTFSGVSSALSSARTLNAGDSIDGGDGNDTLNVTLDSGFGGFSGDGGVQNVESVAVSNDGSIARTFNATGVDGVQQYSLNGNVNLAGLADTGAAVSVADRTADLKVAYADKVTDGDADALNLSVYNVGTVDDAETTKDERQAVAATAAGIEELNLTTAGDNVLDLNGVSGVEAITASGTGTLDTNVATATKTVDASANEGAITVNLGNATDATAVTTGAGDDTVTADTGSLAANAAIDGGDGANTLALSGSGATQYQLANVQTLSLGNVGGLTFSARDVSGLERVALGSAFQGDAVLAKLGNQDLTLALSGDNQNGGTLTSSHGGVSVVDVSASESADADNPDSHDAKLVLTRSQAVDLNVGENTAYKGEITAGAATSAVVNVARGAGSSAVDLQARNLIDLSVTSAADLDVDGALGRLESLNVETDGNFDAFDVDFSAIHSVELSGDGFVALDVLGSRTQSDYGITVDASELKKGLLIGPHVKGAQALDAGINTQGTDITVRASDVQNFVDLGTLDADNGAQVSGDVTVDLANIAGSIWLNHIYGNNVTIDVSDALGPVEYSGILRAADTLVLDGAELTTNVATVAATGESLDATLNGGIAVDRFTVNAIAATRELALQGDLGVGSDVVTVDVSDYADNAEIAFDASFQGSDNRLVFAFDNTDTLVLKDGSSIAGVETLEVQNGTLDISALSRADFAEVGNVVIASGIAMRADQFAGLSSIEANSSSARVTVSIDSAEQAEQVKAALATIQTDAGAHALNLGIEVAQSVVDQAGSVLDDIATRVGNGGGFVARQTEQAGGGSPVEIAGAVPLAEALAADGASFADGVTLADVAYWDPTTETPIAFTAGTTSLDVGSKTLLLRDGADISGLALSNVAGLRIEDAATVTLTPTQYTQFTSLNAGVSGTPGHETVVFSDGGAVDLSDSGVPYNYVEEYRLSDAGNVFTGPDGGFIITGGAGADTITTGTGNQTVTGNGGDDIIDLVPQDSGSDTLVYTIGEDGDDTILGFRAATADGNPVLDAEEDVLRITSESDAAHLAEEISSISFIENDGYTGYSDGIAGNTVDVEIAFYDGGSITFADFIAAGSDLSGFSSQGSFSGGDGDKVVEADETVVLTGITGSELSAAFGDSLAFSG
ncbi:hypothetical protein KGQ90_16150 [Modicisalibacter tunisiensis]|uniref:beta strand repeat-containing protein n=1 Tax=Modicisalibacter tunisiensis TaxID=390637 RepID=UPI001CCAD152|nr:hypothetical protein [Modicisalibacter tunisiensis]MBZ9540451.1 hypothetical protein [Modicisalibacter tunisiensis]